MSSGFEEIFERVYLMENFLSDEEVLYLKEFADSATEDDWRKQNYENLLGQAEHLYGPDAKDEIAEYIKRNTSEFYNDKVIRIPDEEFCLKITERMKPFFEEFDVGYLHEIQRQYVGVSLDEHYDAGYDNRIKQALIIYINDDFIDGELYFVGKDFKRKLPAGSAITFPATEDYVHGVAAVGEGPTRYVIPSFLWEKGALESYIEDH
jgi:hypothetical protein